VGDGLHWYTMIIQSGIAVYTRGSVSLSLPPGAGRMPGALLYSYRGHVSVELHTCDVGLENNTCT